MARTRQQAHGASQSASEPRVDEPLDARPERFVGGAEMVLAMEGDGGAPADRPEATRAEGLGEASLLELVEVDVEQLQAEAEAVLDGLEASMPDHAVVEAALERVSRHRPACSSSSIACSAETTPSSWKP